MPTANRYTHVADISCKLLAKYWPGHPPIDLLCLETRPQAPNANIIQLGQEINYLWPARFAAYLEHHSRDELVLIIQDDYGLFQPPRLDVIQRGIEVMQSHPECLIFHLTWQPTGHYADPRNDGKHPLPGVDNVQIMPRWAFSVNTQAALWRRADLLQIIKAIPLSVDIWSAEQSWSGWFNDNLWPRGKRMFSWAFPDPPNGGAFVDGVDKSQWAIAYHNLYNHGNFDPRHYEFLKREGLMP